LKKGPIYVALCYVLWGILPVFWKLFGEVSSLYILACRVVFSLIFCFVVVVLEGKLDTLRLVLHDKKQCLLLCACGIMITINWGSFILSVSIGHVMESSLAYYMNPIMAIVLGFFVFHERLKPIQWVAVGLAFIGILIPLISYGKIPWLALVIGITMAVYSAMKKYVKADSEISIFMETLFVSPFALVYIIYAERTGIGASDLLHGWQWLLLPAAGIVTSVPLAMLSFGIKTTPLSLSGIMMYINPTLQLLVSVLLFHEKFTIINGITFAFVWVALILFVYGNTKTLRAKETASHTAVE
jgi:chloramphenicol-sensitive protein RarD